MLFEPTQIAVRAKTFTILTPNETIIIQKMVLKPRKLVLKPRKLNDLDRRLVTVNYSSFEKLADSL